MAPSCETRYISTGCNRTPGCVSWGTNNVICFGACNSVAVYDPKEAKIVQTVCHHKERVNSVRWVKNFDGKPEVELLSASSDKTAAVWVTGLSGLLSVSATLTGHTDIVTEVDGVYIPCSGDLECTSPQLYIATASADCTVRIWQRDTNSLELRSKHVLSLGSGLCMSLRLCVIPDVGLPLLAISTEDAKIHLYIEDSTREHLVRVHSLVGHYDWVRSIDFAYDDDGDILLASADQDTLIRIWRLSPRKQESSGGTIDLSNEIKLEEDVFSVEREGQKYHWASILDSVLAGHEGWVYAVCWQPPVKKDDGTFTQPLCLLSASLDKSMIVWSPENDADSVWLEKARVGEVGGNTLGFYGCQFSPNGRSILAHGYNGSFHLWNQDLDGGLWQPGVTVSGHFNAVTDLGWEPHGSFVISVSADQTTRLHAPWVQEGKKVSWHEIARPQVHGYDLQCLAILSRYKFASGAEEKVVRSFQAPGNFIQNLRRICGVQESNSDGLIANAPCGASVPSLGLSNKAVYDGDIEPPSEERHVKDEYPEAYFTQLDLDEPPTEENLLQNTLWPEMQKLYGHGYEIYSLAASHNGKWLVSACKASNAQHAAIILWDAETWQQLQRLESHELTVTQLAFCPNDTYLLSVSRDRRWSLFQQESSGQSFKMVCSTNKSTGVHTRIIWCCAWTHDSKFFSTGSREGKIVIWGGGSSDKVDSPLGQWSPASTSLDLKESVTSLAFAPITLSEGHYLLAAGLEGGRIIVYRWRPSEKDCWCLHLTMDQNVAHHLTVTRLAFRPLLGEAGENQNDSNKTVQLASAAADHSVKIHCFAFTQDNFPDL